MRICLPVAAAVLLALAVSACSSSVPVDTARLDSSQSLLQLQPKGLPAPSRLDGLVQATGKLTSANNVQDGSAFSSASPGAQVSGTSVVLDATAGGPAPVGDFEWAVYAFDALGAPMQQVTVSIVPVVGGAYICRPDFVEGRWTCDGTLNTTDVGIPLSGAGSASPAGIYYIAVAVQAENNVTVPFVNFITSETQNGTPTLVESDGFTGWYTSLAIVDGNPAIAYCEFATDAQEDGDLKYVRATDATGSAWGDPVVIDTVGDTGHDCKLVVVNGRPAITYQDFDNYVLRYVRASDATGSAWGTPLDVDATGFAGNFMHMQVVNGNPAIVHLYWPIDGDSILKYVRASDADGSAWGSPVELATLLNPDDISDNFNMAVINGNPAVVFADENAGPLSYRRAADANGSAWSSAVPIDAGLVQWCDLIADAGGRPCISYYESTGGPGSETGVLRFVRASDGDGSSWGSAVDVDTNADTGFFNDMLLYQGRPVIAYYNLLDGALMLALAGDAEGTSWNDKRFLDSTGDTGAFPSVAELTDGNLALSYLDIDNQDLRFVGGVQ